MGSVNIEKPNIIPIISDAANMAAPTIRHFNRSLLSPTKHIAPANIAKRGMVSNTRIELIQL